MSTKEKKKGTTKTSQKDLILQVETLKQEQSELNEAMDGFSAQFEDLKRYIEICCNKLGIENEL